jgi:hypothetical protein
LIYFIILLVFLLYFGTKTLPATDVRMVAGVTFGDAEANCKHRGARLCTIAELEAGAIYSGTVCDVQISSQLLFLTDLKNKMMKPTGADDACDLNHVWSSTTCDDSLERVWVQFANPSAATAHSKECRHQLNIASARCCADQTAYPDWNECDCEGCNGLGDCDRDHGRCTNTLGSYQCSCEGVFYKLAQDGKACVLECPFSLEIDGQCDLARKSHSSKHFFFFTKK